MAHNVLRASVTADSATTTGGPATVLVDGADTAVTANGLQDYTPTPGDRLLVVVVGGVMEIIQFISQGTIPYIDSSALAAVQADADAAQAAADAAQTQANTATTNAATAQSAADAAQSAADAAAADAAAAQTAAAAANTLAQTKNRTFVQATAPSALTVGDIWVDTSNGNEIKVASATGTGGWVLRQDASIAAAQTTADGKNTTFVQGTTPTATRVGDIWIDTSSGNLINTWDGSDWVARQDAAIAAATVAISLKTTVTVDTATPSGIPNNGDEWVQVDAFDKVLGRWYGQSGSWVSTTIGSNWIAAGAVIAGLLEDNLELTTHVVAADTPNVHDWTANAMTLTKGALATTGGTLTSAKQYRYYIEAFVTASGLYTPLSPAIPGELTWIVPTTTTSTQAMSWSAVTGATNYRVWRVSVPVAGGLQTVEAQTVTGTSFTDTGAGWTTTAWVSNARVELNGVDGLVEFNHNNVQVAGLDTSGGVQFSGQIDLWIEGLYEVTHGVKIINQQGAASGYPSGVANSVVLALGEGSAAFNYIEDSVSPDSGWEYQLTAGSGADLCTISMEKDPATSFDPTITIDGPRVNFPHPEKVRGVVEPGMMMEWGGGGAPAGWHVCDGTALSRTFYADLFANIGTTFGVGDGSTTFNLPDYRDRVSMGASGTKAVGSTGGAATITLTLGNLPAHTHGVGTLAASSHTHGVGTLANAGHIHAVGTLAVSSHTHGVGTLVAASESAHTHGVGSFAVGAHTHTSAVRWRATGATSGSAVTVTDVDTTTGASGGSTGSGAGGSTTPTFSGTSAAGSAHTHALSGSTAAATPTLSGSSASAADTISGATAAATPTLSGSTGSAGSGTAVDSLDPYLAVNKIIFLGA